MLIEQSVARGMDLVDAFRSAAGQSAVRGANRALDREHRRAIEVHRRTVVRHDRRVRRWQREATGGAALSGATGVIGVLDLAIVGAVPGAAWLWFGAALAAAATSVRARSMLRRTRPPAVPLPSVAPPPILPRGAIGSAEVSRFTQVRVQVASIATSLDHLHPGAGGELRRADAEAAGPLTALAERLLVLHQLRQQLPDSAAARAAADSANVVRQRLADGSATYDELLAAAARLLSAPDAGRSTTDVLGPAINAMIAYAHGLERASESLRREV